MSPQDHIIAFVSAYPIHAALVAVLTIFLVGVASEIMSPSKQWDIKGLVLASSDSKTTPKFLSKKVLCIKDALFIAFLNEELDAGKQPCYVITDPEMEDNPIIYASSGFCNFTGYTKIEVENRNCRFLQGADTKPEDKAAIREAIEGQREVSVQLKNYKRDGTSFLNQFFLMPLRDHNKKVIYYIGVQQEILPSTDKKQEGENSGWRVFHWIG